MKNRLALILTSFLIAAGMGCGSSRVMVEGYNDSMLTGKRIAVVVPAPDELVFYDEAKFAYSRGITTASARDQMVYELRQWLAPMINERTKSNKVFAYQNDVISKLVPIKISEDIGPRDVRNWDKVQKAAMDGKFDYMLVLNHVDITNRASQEAGVGDEAVQCDYSLLDPQKKRVMVGGEVRFTVREPRIPQNTCDRLAEEIIHRLPFPYQDVSR